MKRVVSSLEIGEGLFAGGPVDVEFEFPNCVAVFQILALSFDVYDDLKGEGMDLSKIEAEDSIAAGRKVFEKIVLGWHSLIDANGAEIPFTDANRDKLAATELAGEIVNAARELVVTRRKAEEKNSVS